MITREFNPLLPIMFGAILALAATTAALASPYSNQQSVLTSLPTYSEYNTLESMGLAEIPLPSVVEI